MPTALNFTITNAGLAAAIAASGDGLQLGITHCVLGTGQYTPTGGETALANRKEKVTIPAGTVTGTGGFNVTVAFAAWTGVPNPYNATEVGFYAGDPDAGGTLFAVYSHPSSVLVARNALDYVAQFALQLSRVPAGSVTIVLDPEASLAAYLIGQHLAAANPHAQYLLAAEKGATNGVAPLVAGKVPAVYIPGAMDDVEEYANLAAFPVVGEAGKLYIAINAGDNPANPTKTYRWSGSAYVNIPSAPGSTDNVPEGAVNLYFTVARVLATVLAGLPLVSAAIPTAADNILTALGKLIKWRADHDGAGGAAHALATGVAAGFMSAADKAKIETAALTGAANIYTASQFFDKNLREKAIAMVGNDVDMTVACLSKTITGATTFTASGLPGGSYLAVTFLEITNGGSAVITYPAGSKFPRGNMLELSADGKDWVAVYTRDGATLNWVKIEEDFR